MIDEAIAERAGDLRLQPLDLLVGEFHHLAGLHIDEMVVMRLRPLLVACAAVAEIVPLENAGLLEELHRAIDRGNGNPRVAPDGPLIDQFHIRMVGRLRQHARNDRSEEHTSELQSLMRLSYTVFCLTQKKTEKQHQKNTIR